MVLMVSSITLTRARGSDVHKIIHKCSIEGHVFATLGFMFEKARSDRSVVEEQTKTILFGKKPYATHTHE